ncbi:MAG: 6-bladed beta-propeller [Bacteroidaceae bacterium]|nr:6-bladed beta-propeller [Bacteroidaceae bacterium]
MKRLFYFWLLLFPFLSCSDRNKSDLYDYQSKQIIDLTEPSDGLDIIDRIQSIDVLDLTVEESWVHLRYPRMQVSDEGYFFLSDKTDFLIGYDKSGNLKFAKSIKGRGRGEIVSVGNFTVRKDSLLIYDRVLGRMLYYTEGGIFRSFLNSTEVKAELLYKTNGRFWGLSIFGDREFDNHYCVKYNNDGSALNNYLILPPHLKGYNFSIGYTDMSYMFHDTLRFMVMHDYNIFSLTDNGLESSFRFKSNHEMPRDYFDGMNGLEMMNPEITVKTMNEGFTGSFSEITETDNYLMVNFDSEKQNQMLLYDKNQRAYGLLLRPDSFFDESMIDKLTTQNVWRYILFSFTRLCVYDNSVYGCAPYSLYYILSKTESLHDEKIRAFYDQVKEFVETQKIESGDMFFFKINFL